MKRMKNFEDIQRSKRLIRMNLRFFHEIVSGVGPRNVEENTKWTQAVPVEQRVAIALRFAGTSKTYCGLEYHFRVSHNFISHIVSEVMEACPEVMKKNCARSHEKCVQGMMLNSIRHSSES